MDRTQKINIIDKEPPLKKSLLLLTMKFQDAKLMNDYDSMADTIECLKSLIKRRAISRGELVSIRKIEEILDWYRLKERRYTVSTPDGIKIVFPNDMPYKINRNLTAAYERVLEQMEKLELI